MTKRTTVSELRFSGRGGHTRLVEALASQSLIGGDALLAGKIAQRVEVGVVAVGTEIISQGGEDTDLLFLLRGRVDVFVNQRKTGERVAGEHVGEMALLDTYAVRSATVRATEKTVFAKISEYEFNKLANGHPQLWRRVALTLSERLRERAKFHAAPRVQPAVFIGSSSEGLKFAECIYKAFRRAEVVPRLWADGVFECSKTTIEDLVREAGQSDFAVLVLSEDDFTRSRGRALACPRDNVIFELGLFMGAIGRERTYILAPRDVALKIPTDLLGLTFLQYTPISRNIARKNRATLRALRRLIDKHGPR